MRSVVFCHRSPSRQRQTLTLMHRASKTAHVRVFGSQAVTLGCYADNGVWGACLPRAVLELTRIRLAAGMCWQSESVWAGRGQSDVFSGNQTIVIDSTVVQSPLLLPLLRGSRKSWLF